MPLLKKKKKRKCFIRPTQVTYTHFWRKHGCLDMALCESGGTDLRPC